MSSKESKKKEKEMFSVVLFTDNWKEGLSEVLPGPWALTQMANQTLIDYTLEWLSRLPDFKDLVVVCCADGVVIEEHIKSNWPGRFPSLRFVHAASAHNFGDAMRAFEENGDVKGDFIMVEVGSLLTDSLVDATKDFRQRRIKDKSCVISLIMSQTSSRHPLRASQPQPRIRLEESGSQRIVHFDETGRSNDGIDYLYDTGVAICSPQIPVLYTGDNVDFITKQDVVKEILNNEEIHGFKAYAHVIPLFEYAALVQDIPTFHSVSTQVLERWSEPLTPDRITAKDCDLYRCQTRYKYLPQGVNVPIKAASIHRALIVGKGCEIGDEAVLENCVIGRNCKIGSKCVMRNTVLMDNVEVGAESCLEDTIIAPNSKIGKRFIAHPRCLIGPNLNLDLESTELSCGTTLTDNKPNSAHEDYNFVKAAFGNAWVWTSDKNNRILWQTLDEVISALEDEGIDCSDAAAANRDHPSQSDVNEALLSGGEELRPEAMVFFTEIRESLKRGIDEKLEINNLKLEINSSKFAYNISMEELNSLFIKALVDITVSGVSDDSQLFSRWTAIIKQTKDLLIHFYSGKEESQMDALIALEEFTLARSKKLLPLIQKFIHLLYQEDILEEDPILLWFKNLEDESEELIRPKVNAFIDWLQEAEEDDSDD